MTEAAVSTSDVRLAPNLDAVLDYASTQSDRRTVAKSTAATPLIFKERWWAPYAVVVTDIAALELALLGGVLLRWALAPLIAFNLTLMQFTGLALAVLVLPLRHTLDGLYPGYGLGPVERLRNERASAPRAAAPVTGSSPSRSCSPARRRAARRRRT